jgi:sRNA-binding protein
MSEIQTAAKLTLGQRVFAEFSWPEGKIPPALAGAPVPVRTGFIEDVKAILPGGEHEALQTAVAKWTRGVPYLYSILKPGAQRVDLVGNSVEDVTAHQQGHARALLEQKQMNQARKKRREILKALDAIDRIFSAPTRESLAEAKKASAEIRQLMTWE